MLLELLTESKIDYISDRQGDKVFDQFQDDQSAQKPDDIKNGKDIVSHIAKTDKVANKFLQWIVNQYIAEKFMIEDLPSLVNTMKEFLRVKAKLDKRDLNQYDDIIEVEKAVEPHADIEIVSGKQESKNEKEQLFKDGDAVEVYRDDKLLIQIPKTKNAACILGKGTRWCTSATEHNMFDYYSKNGPLYIVHIDKKKFQFHFETGQFANEEDRMQDILKLVQRYPELRGKFPAKEINASKDRYPKNVFLLKKPKIEDVHKVLEKEPHAILAIDNPSTELKVFSVLQKPKLFDDLRWKNSELMELLKNRPQMIVKIKDPTDEMLKLASIHNPTAFKHMKERGMVNDDDVKSAVMSRPETLRYVENPPPELVMSAMAKHGPRIFPFLKPESKTKELLQRMIKKNKQITHHLTPEDKKTLGIATA